MYGLDELCDEYGMTIDEILAQGTMDGICPSICTNCGEVYNYEPDQDQGWCEVCQKHSVKSALVLAGMI